MNKDFINDVDNGNVASVRLDLSNELLLDPRGKTFKEMLTYAMEKLPNLFEENEEVNYTVPPQEEWDQEFLFMVKNDLDINFSKEKLAFYQAVIEYVGKDKAKKMDKEEQNLNRQTTSQTKEHGKGINKTAAIVTTGGAILTIVALSMGKTLLTIIGGTVFVGGVLLNINNKQEK